MEAAVLYSCWIIKLLGPLRRPLNVDTAAADAVPPTAAGVDKGEAGDVKFCYKDLSPLLLLLLLLLAVGLDLIGSLTTATAVTLPAPPVVVVVCLFELLLLDFFSLFDPLVEDVGTLLVAALAPLLLLG